MINTFTFKKTGNKQAPIDEACIPLGFLRFIGDLFYIQGNYIKEPPFYDFDVNGISTIGAMVTDAVNELTRILEQAE